MTLKMIAEIEQLVKENSLLNHPFYKAWSNGSLTQDQLICYAKEYYFLVQNIPQIMEKTLENIPENNCTSLEKALLENFKEEQEHIHLWERFARSLSITEEELHSYTPSKKVQEAVDLLLKTASLSFEHAISLMYAVELELPQISATKESGLKEFYNLDSEDALIYFQEHAKEEKHLKVWRDFLRQIPEERAHDLFNAARHSIFSQHKVLDGVVASYGAQACCA
jgi:pyrroloquinoline-quinone synthase